MKTSAIERITVRKLLRPVGGFRYAAAPHLKAGGDGREAPFGEYLGLTRDEAREKAEKAVTAWESQH